MEYKKFARWTEEEEIKIKEIGYNIPKLRELLPHRTKSSIKSRLQHLKIGKFRGWSPEDDAILIANFEKMSHQCLKEKFFPQKHRSQITLRCLELNLKRTKKIEQQFSKGQFVSIKKEDVLKRKKEKRKIKYEEQFFQKYLENLVSSAKYRAKRDGVPFNITAKDLFIPKNCPILGIPLFPRKGHPGPNSPSIDKKIPNLGYVKGNCWIISHKANAMKTNASTEEIKKLSDSLRYSEITNRYFFKSDSYKNILIIGENCKDIWVYGKPRLNPEFPSLTFSPEYEHSNNGMAENVMANMINLSGDTNYYFISNYSIMTKIRYVDKKSGAILFRTDLNDKLEESLSIEDFHKEIDCFAFKKIDAIVVSDYNKGFLSENTISYIINFSKEKNIPFFMDTKKVISDWAIGSFCIKINDIEYDQNFIDKLNPRKTCENLIVTTGKSGSEIKTLNKHVSTPEIDVANVCGCGDTFLSGLVIRYLETGDIEKSVRFANLAATLAATVKGVYRPTRKEVEDYSISKKYSID